MTIRLLLGMESGSTTHSPGAILNLNPALEADLVSTNRATWVTPPALTGDAGKPVQAVTSPGGGNRFLTAGNSPLWLQGASLLDRVPLPKLRSIAEPESMDPANGVWPQSITWEWVDAPDERYGRALQINVPANRTSQRVMIPIKPDFLGNYPRARMMLQWRLFSEDWSKISTLSVHVQENVSTIVSAQVGHFWSLTTPSSSRYGMRGPYTARIDGRYRTMITRADETGTTATTPKPWNAANPEYEVRAIALQFTTGDAPATIRLNRVCCEEWVAAGIITQLDGTYLSAYHNLFLPYRSRGWPGVGSNSGGSDPAESASAEQMRDLVAAGWDAIQHVNNLTDTIPPVSRSMNDFPPSVADLRRVFASWQRWADGAGWNTAHGRSMVSHLQNSGPALVANAVDIYREHGIRTSRGATPDSEYGIDPFLESSATLSFYDPIAHGWNPPLGRYNRGYHPASNSVSNIEKRHTFAGSSLEILMQRTLAENQLAWIYFHRTQEYDGTSLPAASQSSTKFAREWLDWMDAQVAADRVVPLSASQADLLTYDRPGDVHLRWDGAWVSRSTGKVAL